MLRHLIFRARRWLELPLLLASCTGLLVIVVIATILVFIACTGFTMWRTASGLLSRRDPRSVPVDQLRDFFSCPDNYAHASIEQVSAETGPWQHYCTLDWGICEYRWDRRRLYVVVDTRGDIITRVRMSTHPRQPGTLVTVWDETDKADPKPT